MKSLLPLYTDRPDREGRDRLEILTALIGAPAFDPIFRDVIIRVPQGHRVYQWACVVDACERARHSGLDLLSAYGPCSPAAYGGTSPAPAAGSGNGTENLG
ncbi:hypothetical protein [Streptomyces sp. NPDC088139]|uniref:hypothetical protein n=1 Tax=Streptomyces sp. NPDC088139 TaxID=3365828 RepID=UPI0038053E2F